LNFIYIYNEIVLNNIIIYLKILLFFKKIENSPFMNKIKEVFETQVTAQEYIPIMLDRELVKSLEPEEVKYF
jgi:hypothetical protein